MVRPKGAGKVKKRSAHVDVAGLIVEAVSRQTERRGLTVSALHEALTAGGYDAARHVSRVKRTTKKLVSNGTLLQSKGPGTVYFMLNRGMGPSQAEAAQSPKAKESPESSPRSLSGESPEKGGKIPRKAKARPNKVKRGHQEKK